MAFTESRLSNFEETYAYDKTNHDVLWPYVNIIHKRLIILFLPNIYPKKSNRVDLSKYFTNKERDLKSFLSE